MKVLVVEPMKAPYEKEIDKGLRSLQAEVDGSIQAVYPFEQEVALVMNEEGKLEGMPLNRALRDEDGQIYDIIAGTFIVVGLTEDSFGSLSEEDMQTFKKMYATPEVFMKVDNKIIALPYEDREEDQPIMTEAPYKADDTAPLMAALTNLGKYNEGELVYKWIHLPISDKELSQVLKEIGIDGVRYEEYFITDYNCDIDGVYDKLGEYTSIRDLNALAERFDCMSSHEIQHFEAIMEAYGASDVAEMINITHNLDCWNFLPDVDNYYDLGWYWIEESGCYDTKAFGNLSNYFDYESFGRDIALDEGGQLVDGGYIYANGDSMDIVYDPVNGYDEAFDEVVKNTLEAER